MNYWQTFFSAEYFFPLLFISLLYPLVFWVFETLEDKVTGQPVLHFLLGGFGRPVLLALQVIIVCQVIFPGY